MKKTKNKVDAPVLGETLNNPLFKNTLRVDVSLPDVNVDEQTEHQPSTGLANDQVNPLNGKE